MLPVSRDKTYAATNHVNLAHLADMQDQIVALARGVHGNNTYRMFAADGWWDAQWSLDLSSGTPVMLHGAAVTTSIYIPLRHFAGDVIDTVRARWRANAVVGSLTMRLKSVSMDDGSVTSIASVASVATAAYETRSINPAQLVASTELYLVEIESQNNLDEAASIEVIYNHPPRTTEP